MTPQNRTVGTGVKMNLIPANGKPNRCSGAILEVGSVWWADLVSRAAAALVAGTIAIVLNTLILDAARLVPLETAVAIHCPNLESARAFRCEQ